jgi:hypothetical protein
VALLLQLQLLLLQLLLLHSSGCLAAASLACPPAGLLRA